MNRVNLIIKKKPNNSQQGSILGASTPDLGPVLFQGWMSA